MRISQAWTVARHDLQLLRQRRGILIGLVAYPMGIALGFPALVYYLLPRVGTASVAAWAPMYLDAFGFWFVIGAATVPTSIAAYSIVGEKVSRSLEPLLSTPTTDGEILLGKTLAALIPTLLAMWAGAVLFQALIDLETVGPLGYLYYPNWQMVVELCVTMPLAALLAIEAAVVVSSRVTDVRSAQQYAAVVFVPMIFLYVAAEVVFPLNVTNLLYISAGFGLFVLFLFWVSVQAFRREEILTHWK